MIYKAIIIDIKHVNRIKDTLKPCLQVTFFIPLINKTTKRTFGIPRYVTNKDTIFAEFATALGITRISDQFLFYKHKSLAEIFYKAAKTKTFLINTQQSKCGKFIDVLSLKEFEGALDEEMYVSEA